MFSGLSVPQVLQCTKDVDLKIALNPYNTQFYMLKYALNTTNSVVIYRFHSYNLEWEINSFKYSNTPYFSLRYHSPRLKIEFDASAVYVCQYNDPQSGGPVGHFIAKLSHSLTPITNITSTTGVLSIQFFCHRSPVICVWTTNHSVTEYWMSNLTVHKTYTFSLPLVSLGFNPRTVETSDGTFTYYLHHNVNDNKTVVLHKKNSSHIGVANEATQLPYNTSLPPPEAYDMIISDSGKIITAMMTVRNLSIGLGGSDIAVSRYSPTLQVESNFILSTALQDNITKVFLYNGDHNVVVVSGSTDGALESPYAAANSRKAFVARFEYFEISSVGTKFPNYVQPGEIINITFSSIPSAANTGIPVVQFKQANCSAVKWTGSILSAMIPPGGLGEPAELLVKFSYLSQTPSVSVQNISYIITPILADVQPKQGPAVGYDISLTCSEIFSDDKDVFVFVGGRLCTNLRHVNSSAVTCRAPPEIMYISYDAPVVSQINPTTIPTGGATISIKGYNFGPCDGSPCAFSNIIVSIGTFGLCTGGVHFNDTDVQCVALEGYGQDRIVNVSIEGRGDTTTISYMRPMISSINPTASVSKNPNVYIDGTNFGGLSASRNVIFQDASTLKNYSCPNVTWISHQNIRCIFTGVDLPIPATLNITVVVGNQFSETSQITAFRTGISNTPPTAHSLNTSVYEEQSVILQFEGYDVDADDSLTMYIARNPLNGFLYQLTETGGRGPPITTIFGPIPVTNSMFRVLYIPDKDFNGIDSFTFKARDFYYAGKVLSCLYINGDTDCCYLDRVGSSNR
ncbi:hypothetical protein BKA69DRAFT_177043 [Paraphysoderma sedebokerense]|nr:hypothetical protein BKA69DRAFT_177043 [Paraphysoderma sedebokerense]